MKRIIAILLAALLGLSLLALPVTAAGEFDISNPYEGTESYGQYKANLHTHTMFSDGHVSQAKVVEAYYAKGYDVLANADHGVISADTWAEKPRVAFPLNIINWFEAERNDVLSTERLAQITAGEGEGRNGRGMVKVPQGIEMNAAVVWKNHVVGLYGGWGWSWWGFEFDYRTPIKQTQEAGGITFIAHPGDWIKSSGDEAIARDPANVNFYGDILRDYESCLGIEIYNNRDTTTRNDRILWDELLMRLLPEDRQVWGFANDDSHYMEHIGLTAEMLFMPENNEANIRTALENGAFLACSKYDRKLIGDEPASLDTPFPGIEKITVAGNVITLSGITNANAADVEWVADGNVIAKGPSIDLKQYADDITCYVRAQVVGEGGVTATQAFGVDKGDGYKHADDALEGWDLAKWYMNMLLKRSKINWLVDKIAGLFD